MVGGGQSPVLCYDEMIARVAEEYLARPHKKPQFILVGTYGPHFPYVAPPDLFYKYLKTARLPATFGTKENFINPVLCTLREANVRSEVGLACQAAYKGMVENMAYGIPTGRCAPGGRMEPPRIQLNCLAL